MASGGAKTNHADADTLGYYTLPLSTLKVGVTCRCVPPRPLYLPSTLIPPPATAIALLQRSRARVVNPPAGMNVSLQEGTYKLQLNHPDSGKALPVDEAWVKVSFKWAAENPMYAGPK